MPPKLTERLVWWPSKVACFVCVVPLPLTVNATCAPTPPTFRTGLLPRSSVTFVVVDPPSDGVAGWRADRRLAAGSAGRQLYTQAPCADGVPWTWDSPEPITTNRRPRPRSASPPLYRAVGCLREVGSAGAVNGVGGDASPRPSQMLGVTVQDCAGTHPCLTFPQEFQFSTHPPEESAATVSPVGAAGPSAPVGIWNGADDVCCSWMYAVTVNS